MANNPNIAQGGGGRDFLSTVGGYMCANSQTVGSLSSVSSTSLPGQGSLAPKGNKPGFEKLQPKSISTNPGSIGTDYKP
jgi:hypothetical protein